MIVAGAVMFASTVVCAATARGEAILSGRVVGVTDGDTLKVLTPERRLLRVRLAEIDAPEHDQAWGQRAKQDLSSLAFGRMVQIATRGQDRYGRVLGRVSVEGVDVNATLVKNGDAWAYREYLTDSRFLVLEAAARSAHRGLWSVSPGVAPWEWRKLPRHGLSDPRQYVLPASAARQPEAREPRALRARVNCAAKLYCREMTSCAEARAYLLQCGLRRLDGDGDGVPCESLCR